MSRNYYQLCPKRTHGPEVAPSICRLIFMRLSWQRRCVTYQSGPECRTDTTDMAGTIIYIKCHITPPPPQHKKCFKTSDHLMYNLYNVKGGLHTRGSPPPPPPPPRKFSYQPGTRPHTRNPITVCTDQIQGRIQGGGPGPPLSENLGIDFYSGFRKKNPGIHFYSGFREKKHKGGVQFEIPRNPGIDFYSGFRTKNPGIHFYSGFRKISQGGGGANLITKKVGPP